MVVDAKVGREAKMGTWCREVTTRAAMRAVLGANQRLSIALTVLPSRPEVIKVVRGWNATRATRTALLEALSRAFLV